VFGLERIIHVYTEFFVLDPLHLSAKGGLVQNEVCEIHNVFKLAICPVRFRVFRPVFIFDVVKLLLCVLVLFAL